MGTVTAYLTLAGIGALTFVPGFLMLTAWFTPRPSHLHLLGAWPLGVAFFAAVGAVAAVVAELGGPSGRFAGVVTYVVLLLPTVVRLVALRRRPIFWGEGAGARVALSAWLAFGGVTVGCFGLSLVGTPDPWAIRSEHIAATKTFGTYHTADNYFQYVNGRALADGEPFAKHYANGALAYPVTSREMLPGLTYAGLRFVLRSLGRAVEESFLCYLAFGIVQNAAVVLGLGGLFLALGLGAKAFLVTVVVLFSSPYAVMNTYFTWFKFAGAGAALLAVAALHAERPPRLRQFLAAGLLFGLATNMHAGNALALPFLVLASTTTAPGLSLRPEYIGRWLCLGGAFLLTRVPWGVTKALYFPPERWLLRGHYFNGVGDDGAPILQAVQLLFATWGPAEQLAHRVGNVVTALRLPEWIELARALPADVPVLWMQFRITYIGFVLVPIGLCAYLASRVTPAEGNDDLARFGRWSVVGLVVLLLVHFSVMYADMTAALPPALILVGYAWMVVTATAAGRWWYAPLLAASAVELGAIAVMIVHRIGQAPFAQARTVMPDAALVGWWH